jgi:hypothetical protein
VEQSPSKVALAKAQTLAMVVLSPSKVVQLVLQVQVVESPSLLVQVEQLLVLLVH